MIVLTGLSAEEVLLMEKLLSYFNWWVLAGIVAVAIVLGIFNNLRVYEEQRVNWFGGPVVATEE